MTQTPSTSHRDTAARFTELVKDTPTERWDDPAPVDGWRARDVVGHLVEWLPELLEGGSDVRLPEVTSVEDDPVAAWTEHCAAVQALLDDPAGAACALRRDGAVLVENVWPVAAIDTVRATVLA